MKTSTDCEKCRFESICPMAGKRQRLAFDDGGLGLCPKLPEMKILRCRNCLFCHKTRSMGGHKQIRHGKRTSDLHLCGDELQPHAAGWKAPTYHAERLPHQRSEKKRPLTSSTRQRPKAEKEISRLIVSQKQEEK